MQTYAQRRLADYCTREADRILEQDAKTAPRDKQPETYARREAAATPEGFFRATRDWILAHRTPAGGFKAAQIRAIGVAYPLRGGWIERADGKLLSLKQKALFEKYADGYKATKKSKAVLRGDAPKVGQAESVRRPIISGESYAITGALAPRCECNVLPWEHCGHSIMRLK